MSTRYVKKQDVNPAREIPSSEFKGPFHVDPLATLGFTPRNPMPYGQPEGTQVTKPPPPITTNTYLTFLTTLDTISSLGSDMTSPTHPTNLYPFTGRAITILTYKKHMDTSILPFLQKHGYGSLAAQLSAEYAKFIYKVQKIGPLLKAEAEGGDGSSLGWFWKEVAKQYIVVGRVLEEVMGVVGRDWEAGGSSGDEDGSHEEKEEEEAEDGGVKLVLPGQVEVGAEKGVTRVIVKRKKGEEVTFGDVEDAVRKLHSMDLGDGGRKTPEVPEGMEVIDGVLYWDGQEVKGL